MKKCISLIVMLALVVTMLAGCGAAPVAPAATPAEVAPAPEEAEVDIASIADPVERLKAMIAAAGWPAKPIELVCCNGVGGGSDQMSRAVANSVNALDVGITINVNNRTGSSGMIGASYVGARPEDEYLLLTQNGAEFGNWLSFPDFGVSKDKFKPVSIVAIDTACLVVRADSEFMTMADLVDYAKENPGKVIFGGSNSNLSLDAIMYNRMVKQAEIVTEFVPYEGGGDVNTALLGGHITAAWQNPSEIAAFVDSGDFRVLAMGSETRHDDYPDVPTAIEQGYSELYFSLYRGVLAPGSLPDEYIAILALAIEIGSQSEAFQNEYIKANTLTYVYCGPEEMAGEMDYYENLFKDIIAENK